MTADLRDEVKSSATSLPPVFEGSQSLASETHVEYFQKPYRRYFENSYRRQNQGNHGSDFGDSQSDWGSDFGDVPLRPRQRFPSGFRPSSKYNELPGKGQFSRYSEPSNYGGYPRNSQTFNFSENPQYTMPPAYFKHPRTSGCPETPRFNDEVQCQSSGLYNVRGMYFKVLKCPGRIGFDCMRFHVYELYSLLEKD